MSELLTARGAEYRTQLMILPQAQRFAACLRGNARFAGVRICESARVRSEKRWYVAFSPSSTARAEAILHRQQESRAARAVSQSFTFAGNSREVFVYSHSSGMTYSLDPDGRGCCCEDSIHRCGPSGKILCKHGLAWLASDEKRELDEALAKRAEESKRFLEIFG
jgi:hypothetical protein